MRDGFHRQSKLIGYEKLSVDHIECIGWIRLSDDDDDDDMIGKHWDGTTDTT